LGYPLTHLPQNVPGNLGWDSHLSSSVTQTVISDGIMV